MVLIFALALFCIGCTKSEGPMPNFSDPTGTSPATREGPAPLLYKVTGKNGGAVWLFGSIHVGTDKMHPLPGYVMNAFTHADALAVECDILAVMENPSSMTNVLMDAVYTDGTTISDHIPKELYDAAVKILKDNNYYMKALDSYMPILWYSFIESFSTANYGYDEEKGIDLFLLNLAYDLEKPILEIESVEFQYGMLTSFSPQLQVMLLEQAVAGYGSPEGKEYIDAMMDAWCRGDEAAVSAMLNEDDTAGATAEELELIREYNTAMITNRNISMADFAMDALETGDSVFICVGMAHVLGDGAMVDLLRQQGYTVELVH